VLLLIIKVLYSIILPPSIFILLLVLLTIWARRREKKVSFILGMITLFFYLTSIPIVSDMLVKSLESRYSPSRSLDGDVIVMLCGGATSNTPDINGLGNLSASSSNRLLTVARLHRLTNLPILISGGQVFESSASEAVIAKRYLIDLGFSSEKIIVEDSSRNTAENARHISEILNKNNFSKPILVTSAYHMERSVRNFKKVDITVQPYPTDYLINYDASINILSFIPSHNSLSNVYSCLKEYIGLFDPR
jgi:uncharacterized SAM-binding protein YcdF (DUF218 family)